MPTGHVLTTVHKMISCEVSTKEHTRTMAFAHHNATHGDQGCGHSSLQVSTQPTQYELDHPFAQSLYHEGHSRPKFDGFR